MLRAMKPWFGAALAPALLLFGPIGCEDQNRATQEPAVGANANATVAPGTTNTGIDTIKESPERFYGKTVHVSASVDEIYGDRAFELEGTGWAFDDNITVLTKVPVRVAGAPLAKGDQVIVTGVVRPFVVANVERDIGWDISPEVEIKLTRRPVLIAESIRKVGEIGSWSATAGASDTVSSTFTLLSQANPAALAGRKVELDNERVQEVTGKGLWIGPNRMAQVFVLPREPVKDVKAGDRVHVTGTLQKIPQDAAKTWEQPQTMQGLLGDNAVFIDAATVKPAPAAAR